MAPSGHRGRHEDDAIYRGAEVTILREADERSVLDVAHKHGVSAQTIYTTCPPCAMLLRTCDSSMIGCGGVADSSFCAERGIAAARAR
jgi:hypothetical protein